jgi:hypothetical protein
VAIGFILDTKTAKGWPWSIHLFPNARTLFIGDEDMNLSIVRAIIGAHTDIKYKIDKVIGSRSNVILFFTLLGPIRPILFHNMAPK